LATTAPVYRGVEAHNVYHPQTSKPTHEELMLGPKLPVESKNLYSPAAPGVPNAEPIMAAPHYRGVSGIGHSPEYFPSEPSAPHEALMTGPKLPHVEQSHSYGPVPARKRPASEMVGPVYPVDAKNKVSV
jgi:hypothetical protein